MIAFIQHTCNIQHEEYSVFIILFDFVDSFSILY